MQGLACCTTCMFMEHYPYVTVISHKSNRILPKRFFLQDWPIFQISPGSPVAPATTCHPLFTIIRYLRGSMVQYVTQALFLPGLPLLVAPMLPLKCFCDQSFSLGAVAPGTQVKTAQTSS